MSIETDYENLNGEVDIVIIRQYVNAGYHLSDGAVMGLCEEIEELQGEQDALLAASEALLIANKIAHAAEDDWQRHIGHDNVYKTIALGQAYEEAQAAVVVCEDALRAAIAAARAS